MWMDYNLHIQHKQHNTEQRKPTHVSLRYNDLVSIDLFLGLLRRHWLESDLHHVCLFSVWLLCLVSDPVSCFHPTGRDAYIAENQPRPRDPVTSEERLLWRTSPCVGLKEKPPRRCQNKRTHPGKTFGSNTKYTLCGFFAAHINISKLSACS